MCDSFVSISFFGWGVIIDMAILDGSDQLRAIFEGETLVGSA